MAGTTIDGLNSVTSLTSQDEVPVWDAEASGEPTKKITAQNMAASVKTLGSLVNTTEMNNALAGKQNTLTFDTTPTTGSTNPVTSGGIADAIAQSTAIVDHGSNANGTYVKFSDGTMICYRVISPLSMNANQTTTETFNFPASFYSTPGVWLTLNTSIPDKLIVSTYGVSTTQYVINKVSTFSATQGPACYVLAVGRWKA